MSEITIKVLLDKIEKEILNRAGQGFTKEINAEITKYQIYKMNSPSLLKYMFTDACRYWKLDRTITSEKYISTFQRRPDSIYYYDRVETVDWDIVISRQVQNQLPKGVFIQKQPPSVLYDGRDYRIDFPSTRQEVSSYVPINHPHLKHVRRWEKYDGDIDSHEIDGRKTPYIEGCRVYLTVSEEYASRILDEVCNSRYPFRNYLLKKYDQILKDIALKWSCWGYHPNCTGQIFIGFSGVRIRGAYEGDCCYDWDSISYEKFGMANLKTYEQLYSMAIALIDTKKKRDSEWTKASYSIRNNNDNTSVCIDVVLLPPETTKQPAIQLKEW